LYAFRAPLFVFFVFGVVLPVCCWPHAVGEARAQTAYTVAVLEDGPGNRMEQYLDQIEDELRQLLNTDETVVFRRLPSFSAGWTVSGAQQALQAALSDPQIHYVLCLGVLTTLAAASLPEEIPKPVFGAFYHDSALFGLPATDTGASGKHNFTFVGMHGRMQRDLKALGQLLPKGPVHVVMERALVDAIPDLDRKMDQLSRQVGLELILVRAGVTAAELLAAVPGNARAVYLTPPQRMNAEQWRYAVDGLARKKVLTFSFQGEPDVRLGVAAGIVPDIVDQRFARRLALHIWTTIQGSQPSERPVALPMADRWFLNMNTASRIEWSPPFEILLRAVRIDRPDRVSDGPALTLTDAMEMATRHSPLIASAQASTLGVEATVGAARSGLFPQLSADVAWQRIDRDRAEASLGLFPLRRLAAGVDLDQVLFDDSIISRYRRARRAFDSAVLEQQEVIQDVMLEAGLRYLEVLSAEALLRIAEQNMRITQRNLELAGLRRESGVAGPEEVLRFESLFAQVRSELIQRESNLKQALTTLNRSMGVNQSSEWEMQALSTQTAFDRLIDLQFGDLLQQRNELERLRDFSIDVAMERMLIRAMAKQIESQQIEIGRLQRRYYIPQLGATARYERRLSEDRATPEIPGLPLDLLDTDPGRDDWMIGIRLSIPLFEGGRRGHQLAGAKAELERLRHDLAALEHTTEQEVRNQLNALFHSYPNIHLTRLSATAAHKNLEVVSEKYARGTVSVIDLLDAQTQAITSDQAAAVAEFAMISDLLRYQRSISWMGMFRDEEERKAFMQQLEAAGNPEHRHNKGIRNGH
jgi:outer membrane protein